VHLIGAKTGVWSDFSTGQRGDALDLVAEVLRLDMRGALKWALRWLCLKDSEVSMPDRAAPNGESIDAKTVNDHWRKALSAARVMGRKIAETYLCHAWKLRLSGAITGVLRRNTHAGMPETCSSIAGHRSRSSVASRVARSTSTCAWTAARSNATRKVKPPEGRVSSAVVMLSTLGLSICEGAETVSYS
jgi:hypothetical protein